MIPKAKAQDSARKVSKLSSRKFSEADRFCAVSEQTFQLDLSSNNVGSAKQKTEAHESSFYHQGQQHNHKSNYSSSISNNKSENKTGVFHNKKLSVDVIKEFVGDVKNPVSRHNSNYSSQVANSGFSTNVPNSKGPIQQNYLGGGKVRENEVGKENCGGKSANKDLAFSNYLKNRELSENEKWEKEKVISDLELVQDFSKTKVNKSFGRNKSLIDIDVSDINFLFDKKLSNAEKIS